MFPRSVQEDSLHHVGAGIELSNGWLSSMLQGSCHSQCRKRQQCSWNITWDPTGLSGRLFLAGDTKHHKFRHSFCLCLGRFVDFAQSIDDYAPQLAAAAEVNKLSLTELRSMLKGRVSERMRSVADRLGGIQNVTVDALEVNTIDLWSSGTTQPLAGLPFDEIRCDK